MPRYMLGGFEDHAALHLVPVHGEHGVDLPAPLYRAWKDARTALDAVERDVVAHLRVHGGRDAVPEAQRQRWDGSAELDGPMVRGGA